MDFPAEVLHIYAGKNSIFSGFLLCHLALAATKVVEYACIEVNQVRGSPPFGPVKHVRR